MKKVVQTALVIIFIFLIGLYFYHHKNELFLLGNINPADLGVLFFLSLLIILAHAVNVWLILKDIGLKGMKTLSWIGIFFVSRFINFHITQCRALYMALKLKQDYGFSFTKSIGAFVYLTWFYTLTALLFCAAALFFFEFKDIGVFLLLCGGFLAILAIPPAVDASSKKLHLRHERLRWIQERVGDILEYHNNIMRKPALVALLTLFALLQFALYCALVYVGFTSIHVQTSPAHTTLFTVILIMSRFYNIVPNNLGLTELICGYFSESFTGTYSTGILVSGLVRVVDYMLVGIIALFFLPDFSFFKKTKVDPNALRRIAAPIHRFLRYKLYQWRHPCLEKDFLACHRLAYRYTLTTNERMLALYNAVKHVTQNNVRGDFVECGVYQGGSSMVAAQALYYQNDTSRKIYMYDTYEGMTEPSEHDINIRDSKAYNRYVKSKTNAGSTWCYAGLPEVQANMRKTDYPENQFVYVMGKVEETILQTLPDSIAILRLDTDWYESTLHELKYLYPLLSTNGILILDDYGYWKGAKKAVDEYMKQHNITEELREIDASGRYLIKKG